MYHHDLVFRRQRYLRRKQRNATLFTFGCLSFIGVVVLCSIIDLAKHI